MGCRSSKPEETPPVALCRERGELICAAADHRYALATAHAAYFRALGRVGDALHRFVQEELTAAAAAVQQPDSPVLTLPPSEGKGKGKGKQKAKIEGSESNADCIDESSSISLSNSEDSHLHFHSEVDEEEIREENGGFRRSGTGRGKGGGGGEGGGGREGGGGGGGGGRGGEGEGGGDSWYYPPYPSYPSYPSYASYPSFGNVGIPNYYYMQKNTTMPTTVYQEPYGGISKPGYMTYGYGYDNPIYGFPMGSRNNHDQDQAFYQSQAMASPQKEVKDDSPPPPPPPPEGSSWDFFNLFDSYEQMFPGYGHGGYGVPSVTSSPNSSEVREREGIPDLEEETEQESVKEAVEEKKVVESSPEGKDAGIGIGSSEAAAEHREAEMDEVLMSEAASQSTFEASKARSTAKNKKKSDVKVKQVSFEEVKSLVTDDSGPSKGTTLFSHGTRDVEEVVKEIKEQFNSAASCGEEVSGMLEVGRMRYRSRNKILRLIFSRIFDKISLPASTTSQFSDLEKINDIEFSNLSSVLDRLCVWEKKLYKEVKEEEKLRLIYDREWKHLKALDDNGAEASKIDATRASMRNLLTRISIAIRSVNAISSRIHKIRDDELQPQLMKLIQGQIKMWKFVLDCHHKQFQAVVESKAHDLVPKTGMQSTASKVTRELEMELLNWCSCFSNWIGTQRDYVEALNGWLVKWLIQEKEETTDGIAPFSPGRMGAPPVFVTANDWYHAIERVSEIGVIDAMQAFAINVHGLWERQDEEQKQKLKADYMSKDFARRLQSLQKKNGMDRPFDLDKTVVSITSNNDPFHDRLRALDALKKRLAEERAKHEETVKHVQEASVGNLSVGLMPIFEALGSFSFETLKGYEGVRIVKGSRVT